jgi:hypothetical protein
MSPTFKACIALGSVAASTGFVLLAVDLGSPPQPPRGTVVLDEVIPRPHPTPTPAPEPLIFEPLEVKARPQPRVRAPAPARPRAPCVVEREHELTAGPVGRRVRLLQPCR